MSYAASTPLTREQMEVEARNLPREERARLAEALLASLDEDAEIERAWQAEIRRRLHEVREGSVETVPAGEVFAKLDGIVG